MQMAFEFKVTIAIFSGGGPSAEEQMRRGGSRVQSVQRTGSQERARTYS